MLNEFKEINLKKKKTTNLKWSRSIKISTAINLISDCIFFYHFQSSVTWTSQIFRWLYSDLVIVNDLLQSWVQALNDHMKRNAEEVSVRIICESI